MPTPCVIGEQTDICTNTTVQDVSLDMWGTPTHVTWTNISGIDEDSAATLIQVGWLRGGAFYPFQGGPAVAAGNTVRLFTETCLPGEYRPTARFFGATLGDRLSVFGIGRIAHG